MPLSDTEFVEQFIKREIKKEIQAAHDSTLIPTGSHEELKFPQISRDIHHISARLKYVGYIDMVEEANKGNTLISRPVMEGMWTHLIRSKIGWYAKIAREQKEDPELALLIVRANARNVFAPEKENFYDLCLLQMVGEVAPGFHYCEMDYHWQRETEKALSSPCIFDATSKYKDEVLETMYEAWLAKNTGVKEQAAGAAVEGEKMAVDSDGDMVMTAGGGTQLGAITASTATLTLDDNDREAAGDHKRRRLN
ncbi:hypothetical protein HYFRA_00003619 [Hymenoscyphus fraxineus]|uniref:Uncharacterized protein n=1 Tax=Hymenoscyphus fraxineus TaxID=746836 RepID=A0A9N9PJU5_9HELO|nr:hypothetical protein HYFRA_00003619 [Hymenoscyphus fraxineus]